MERGLKKYEGRLLVALLFVIAAFFAFGIPVSAKELTKAGEQAPVASITRNGVDMYYVSLPSAVEDAEDGEEIKLLENCKLNETLTINKNITINLRDKQLAEGDDFTTSILNPLIDVSNASVSFKCDDTYEDENSSIKSLHSGCIKVGYEGIVNIDSVNVICAGTAVYLNHNTSEIVFNNSAVMVMSFAKGISAIDCLSGKVVMNSSVVQNLGEGSCGIYLEGNNSSAEINNFDYNTFFASTVLKNSHPNNSVSISGGVFSGKIDCANKYFISGGFFSEEIPLDYCAEGYIPADSVTSEEYPYSVKEGWKVSYYPNGGTGDVFTVPVAKGEKLELVDSPYEAPECGTFEGWLVGKSTEAQQPGANVEITADTEVNASWVYDHKWSEPEYKWAPDYKYATAKHICTVCESTEQDLALSKVESTKEPTADEEGEIVYSAEFKMPGFEKQTTSVTIPKLKTYKVTIDPNGGVGEPKEYSVTEGEKFPLPKNDFTAPENMDFAGWLVGDSEEVQAEETEIDVTEDVTVKASWKEKVIPVDPDEPVNPDDKDKDDSGKKDDQGKDDGKQEDSSKKVKADNTLKVKAKTVKVKYAKLKKKSQSIKIKKAVKISTPQGKVTYKKVRVGSKKINKKYGKKFLVNAKTGKITVKKGVKKGTYKLKLKVSAAGNESYKASTKIIVVKIRIK